VHYHSQASPWRYLPAWDAVLLGQVMHTS
jgi:hypothetical protein